METLSPDPDHVRIWRWQIPVKTVLKFVLVVAVMLVAFSGILWLQNSTIRHNQAQIQRVTRAANCWDRVLVVALHDHLTPAERQALIAEAEGCATLTEPAAKHK